jgi:alkaline phosphatase D
MPPVPADGGRTVNPRSHRIVCYHQTYYPDNGTKYVSMLPLLANNSGVTHVILAAIHINDDPQQLTLNDNPPNHPQFIPLWAEARVLQAAGVKILGLLGGAARGSFERLDQTDPEFDLYYEALHDLIRDRGLDGLDLDVEEPMSLPGIIRLIDRLKLDFGDEFIITLAPVATALIAGLRHLSGFDYRALEEAQGSSISWYNAQFYNGWGLMDNPMAYDIIISQGWPAEKVIVGQLTNPGNGAQGYVPLETTSAVLAVLLEKYPLFGGVSGWEYHNSMPGDVERPWQWACAMSWIMALKLIHQRAVARTFT